jgi:hypothetical protein
MSNCGTPRALAIALVGLLVFVARFDSTPAYAAVQSDSPSAEKTASKIKQSKKKKKKASTGITRQQGHAGSGPYAGSPEAEMLDPQDQETDPPVTDVAFPSMGIDPATPTTFDGDVRDLPQVPVNQMVELNLQEPASLKSLPFTRFAPLLDLPNNLPSVASPAAIASFAGMAFLDNCGGSQCGAGHPPDTNGEVGPAHYIQSVNDAYAIYDKASGSLLASFTENSLFANSNSICATSSFGDPVVVYDKLADRWILTNFAFGLANTATGTTGPYLQCFAVSKTGNPVTGGWFLYSVRIDTGLTGQPPVGTLGDYPKFGVWTDCLYMGGNGFSQSTGRFVGPFFGSFSRSDMYSGSPLTGALGFISNRNDPFTMIPANFNGKTAASLPPSGTPEYIVSESNLAFAFEVRKFTAGTNCGGGGSLSAATNVTQASYTTPAANIVPQPPPATTANLLDSLGDRLMQKVQYRNVGGTESLWVIHTTRSSASSTTRPQWAQLDVTGGTIAANPAQQQIYAPDTTIWRWMGSVATDNAGNAAIEYSTSDGVSNFPSIAYSGRLASDPLNQLPQGETFLVVGGGSQTNNCGGAPCHRWGDYSSISVDPADDCTFWMTNLYHDTQANGTIGNWQTRIGSFKFPSCVPVLPVTAAIISAKSGTASSRNWTIKVSNGGPGFTDAVNITGLQLKQTFGAACSPIVNTNFPLPIGDIASGGSTSGSVNLSFAGCAATARFSATISYSANAGASTGSQTLNNQFQ